MNYLALLLIIMMFCQIRSYGIQNIRSKLQLLKASSSSSSISGSQSTRSLSQITVTGSFKRELPDVFIGSTHFRRALKSLKEVKPDMNIKNHRNRRRKYAAQTLDSLMKGLTVPLTNILKSYKYTMNNLHPYEKTVADLTLIARVKAGEPELDQVLKDVKALRAETSRIAKFFASQAKNASSAAEADAIMEEGMQALESLYGDNGLSTEEIMALYAKGEDNENDEDDTIVERNEDPLIGMGLNIEEGEEGDVIPTKQNILSSSLNHLIGIQKDLRSIPMVELATPTVVLVGAPNVGKSSIVRAVSSGTPEVNNYPFTTRGVTIGHISEPERNLRFQVMDTPGLLDRPEDERNEMERLTFASLAHLPTAVIFVIDATGLSGERLSSVQAQLNVRNYLRSRFPKRPWLDVVSKSDLKDTVSEEILASMPKGFLHISTEDGNNVQVLQEQIEVMMDRLRQMLMEMQRQRL